MVFEAKKLVAVLSGGLDSTTMAHYLEYEGHSFTSFVSFNYGQRHKKELEFAARTAKDFDVKHHIINLWSSGFTDAVASSGSSLVSDTPVPEGHYAADNMKATVVPNRNMVMIAIAGAIAVAENAHAIAVGVHAGDHFIYPDCRPEFISAAGIALEKGNEGFGQLDPFPIVAPFLHKSKADIAYAALKLGVPIHETWSCYKGDDIHCGKCGTCVERLEAIAGAVKRAYGDDPVGMYDTTEYAEPEYWRTAVKEA